MGTVELINGDCMEYMKTVDDKYFDLAIVDPPYGLGTHTIKNGSNRTNLAPGTDYKFYKNEKADRPTRQYFQELERISLNRIIWGANHLCDLFDAAGPGWIVWEKEASWKFSDCELAYSSFNRSLRRFRYRWNGMIQGDHGDKRLNEKRIHPSQKPVALYEWLIMNYADPGQKILDTHLGSGSSAIAALRMDFDFVGIEIDVDYMARTRARLEAETSQMRLDFIHKNAR